MTRIYEYDTESRYLAVWGCLVRPVLVRESEDVDVWDYDEGRDCPGGDA